MADDLAFDPSIKKKKKSSKPKPTFSDDIEDTNSQQQSQNNNDEQSISNNTDSVDDVSDLMASLSTKKKKKSKSTFSPDSDASPTADDNSSTTTSATTDTPPADNVATFDAKKKKKKKKPAAAADFDALLQEAGVSEKKASKSSASSTTASSSAATSAASTAVNERGEHDFTYPELLSRFFKILADKNPELASDRTGQKYKIPPPEVKRDGKKTLFINIMDIAERIHRPPEHVISFLYAELGTTGSVDGSGRLVIKGRFQQAQIETVLRKYIVEYVTCKTCKSINTKLRKENRLFFLDCNSCASRRSVSSIKTGYQAIIKRPKAVS